MCEGLRKYGEELEAKASEKTRREEKLFTVRKAMIQFNLTFDQAAAFAEVPAEDLDYVRTQVADLAGVQT